jgi:adhesin transport system membrane fusion protein
MSGARPRRGVLEAEHLVPPAQRARSVARWLAIAAVAFLCFALLAPWRQNVSGMGQVTAYAPDARRQGLHAPISGRVVRWFVREGTAVREGEPLVELSDNDPAYTERLTTERDAVAAKLSSYEQRLQSLARQMDAAVASRKSEVITSEAKVRAAAQKLKANEQKLQAAEAAVETAVLQLGRVRALADRGLSSQREVELADLASVKARTERDSAQADVRGAVSEFDAARASVDKARAEGDAKIQETEAKLRSGQSDVADARASLAKLDVNISRQARQLVLAPRASIVFRVFARQGGEQVKQGDALALLVPDTHDRAVELWVDGNDAAIISGGRQVRLQFEGWPAVQFAGWPSVAVGSFGGLVAFVDPHDDGNGDFRVVVLPDPQDAPWPSPRFLRQGVRVKGWVLLEEVRIGFELWRRFNGFPPMLRDAPGFGATSPVKASKDGKQ